MGSSLHSGAICVSRWSTSVSCAAAAVQVQLWGGLAASLCDLEAAMPWPTCPQWAEHEAPKCCHAQSVATWVHHPNYSRELTVQVWPHTHLPQLLD